MKSTRVRRRVFFIACHLLVLVLLAVGYLAESKELLALGGLLGAGFGLSASILLGRQQTAEEELQATREQMDSFFDSTADAIGVFDLDGRMLRKNQASERIFGYGSDENIGQPVQTIPDESYRAEVDWLQDKVRNGESVIGYETVRRHKDGTLIDVSITYSPIRDGEGRVVGFANILRDISERKRTEELLRNSEKLRVIGELAAGVAHEIRNPLTALRGFVQLQQQGKGLSPTYFDIMLEELDRINFIVSELLLLAKPQAVHFKKRDLVGLLRNVLTLVDTQAIMNNVQVLTEIEQGLPEIVCEENQLKQVFINLLKNAIEAMPSGGDIELQVKRQGEEHVLVRVLDHGCGIPVDLIPKLGEPFYTTKEKGTGLGLMVSHKIIQYHHGQIRIDSREQQGTTIDVVLPIAAVKTPEPTAATALQHL